VSFESEEEAFSAKSLSSGIASEALAKAAAEGFVPLYRLVAVHFIRYSVIGAAVLVLVISLITYRRHKRLKKRLTADLHPEAKCVTAAREVN